MKPWLKRVLQGLGGGTAITLGLALIKAVETRPEFLPQLLGGNAPLFTVLIVFLFMVNQRFAQFTDLQTRSVAANERLAANVGALVAKDDQKAREQDLLLNYMASQTEKILAHLEKHTG